MEPTAIFQSYIERLKAFMNLSASAETPPNRHSATFNKLALELFSLQYQHNPVVRQWAFSRSVEPASIRDWSQIPALPAAAFKEMNVTALPPSERVAVFRSSGTTLRNSSRHFHSRVSLEIYEESLWPWFERHLLCGMAPESFSLLALAPAHRLAPHSSLAHMFETVKSKSGPQRTRFAARLDEGGGWELEFQEALAFLEESILQQQPVLILGTAFMFVHLVDRLASAGKRVFLPAGSRVMETGGYKGRSRTLAKQELHRLICHYLGLAQSHIVCEYGMAELSSQGYDRAAGDAQATGFYFPPWARVRIVSPETGLEAASGELGLIQIYDLANVFSAMAVQTEDLGVRRGEGCELAGRAALTEARGCSLLAV